MRIGKPIRTASLFRVILSPVTELYNFLPLDLRESILSKFGLDVVLFEYNKYVGCK